MTDMMLHFARGNPALVACLHDRAARRRGSAGWRKGAEAL